MVLISARIRWEAFKAFIRGQIISFTSPKKKRTLMEMKTLDEKKKKKNLKQISTIIKLNLSTIIIKLNLDANAQLVLLRSQYNERSANKAAIHLMKHKQSYYDQGEKPRKLLAWRIKQQQIERSINYIEDQSGKTIVDPKEINEAFKVFYEKLFTSEGTPRLDK